MGDVVPQKGVSALADGGRNGPDRPPNGHFDPRGSGRSCLSRSGRAGPGRARPGRGRAGPGPGRVRMIRNGQNERRAHSRISQSVLKRARFRPRFLQQFPLGNPPGNLFQKKILLVRRELDKCIFQVILSQKEFLRKLPTFLKKRQSSFWSGPANYYDSPSPLAPCRFLQARAQSRISQSVGKRCACPSPFPFPGLCSSIHPKRERFPTKRIVSKYLRKTTKWGADVPLRVLRQCARARVLEIFCDFFVPRFPHKMGATSGCVLHSARFACSCKCSFWMI